MNAYDKITPEGTRDLLFEECEAVKAAEHALNEVFRSRGYHEVVTPGIEFFDVFNKPGVDFAPESLYKLIDSKGRLLVMRPDSTMPIARLVGIRLRELPLPLRLFYNQPVYRTAKRLTGRSDEQIQTGIELIGAASIRSDLEVLVTAVEALKSCGVEHYRLEIGHIGIFQRLISSLEVSEETRETIRSLIEGKNYPALGDLLEAIPDENAKLLSRLPRMFGGPEVLEEAAELFCENPEIMEIISYLKKLYADLLQFGSAEHFLIDLSLVQHNNYYTGVVFLGYTEGSGEPVLSGGRYDNLLSAFGADYAAIGFGVDIDAVAQNRLREGVTLSQPALLVHAEVGYYAKALQYAQKRINSGEICEYSPFETEQEAKEYAVQKHIPQLAVVGECVMLIDLTEGDAK